MIGLEQRQAVVVGGGSVAARKVVGLLETGAQVTVISPELAPELVNLVEQGYITAVKRAYQEGDLTNAFIAVAGTDDPAVNEAVWQEAEQRGCLVNVVDDPAHSNYIMPAVVRRGEMVIAISTGGASPALARRLREWLETLISPEYAGLVELLAELRPDLVSGYDPGEARLEAALRLVDSELLEVIRREGRDAAKRYAQEILNAR